MMETEIQMLEVPACNRRPKTASRCSSSGSTEYTSLKDVLLDGAIGGSGPGSGYDIHGFDASNIGIRNQLLKHAASAYLQSAVILTSRDQSCLTQLWRRLQRRQRHVQLHRLCTWQRCVNDPFDLCFAFMARSARVLVAFLVDRVGWMRA